MTTTSLSFQALLQGFFTNRLTSQLGASPSTVASYRDTFRLLLVFAAKQVRRRPSGLRIEDLDVPLLSTFLDHLQQVRGNATRTRNTRLSALHAFFRHVSFSEPAYALQCQRVLAIPAKRHQRPTVEYLIDPEVNALLAVPDLETWLGRRDRTLLLVAVQTGLRNGEIRALRNRDVELGTGAHVRCTGKGRKMRCTPLRRDVASSLEVWLSERGGDADDPVFPSSRGGRMSADALQRLVARHAAVASKACPSLAGRTITPHTLRHTTAMTLLCRGVDRAVIALWLGHESVETTQAYLHADMRLKEAALAHADASGVPPNRYQPADELLAFLKEL